MFKFNVVVCVFNMRAIWDERMLWNMDRGWVYGSVFEHACWCRLSKWMKTLLLNAHAVAVVVAPNQRRANGDSVCSCDVCEHVSQCVFYILTTYTNIGWYDVSCKSTRPATRALWMCVCEVVSIVIAMRVTCFILYHLSDDVYILGTPYNLWFQLHIHGLCSCCCSFYISIRVRFVV